MADRAGARASRVLFILAGVTAVGVAAVVSLMFCIHELDRPRLTTVGPPGIELSDVAYGGRIYRVDDSDAGVSCWVLLSGRGGGISCVEVRR